MRSDGNRVRLSFAICVSSGAVECASVEGDIGTYAVVCVTERGALVDGGDDDDDGARRAVRSSRLRLSRRGGFYVFNVHSVERSWDVRARDGWILLQLRSR